MTEEQWQAWLRADNAQRVWLVELDHTAGTERIARGVFTEPGKVWSDVLEELDIEDRLDGELVIDQLSLVNLGARDDWLLKDWDGQPVRIYLGDERWKSDDFTLIAQLINGGISTASKTGLSFDLHNPLALLDEPLQSVVDEITLPFMFGSPFNVSPLLIDENLGYQLHDQAVTVTAVRDGGNAVAAYTPNTTGFSLGNAPAGEVTVDATAPYGTSKEIVGYLAQSVGLTVNAASLAALPDYPVAYYANANESKRTVFDAVLTGLGAHPRLNALGEIEISITTPPASVADITLNVDDIELIELVGVERPAKDVLIQYGRNWTVQNDSALVSIVSDADRLRYSTEWQQLTQDIAPDNTLAERIERQTLLLNEADAQAELDKLAALRGVQRQRWRLVVVGAGLDIKAGQTINVVYPRYGFAAGQHALVLSNAPTGNKLQQSEIEVWL